MRELLDFTGRRIRLTAERWSHIQEHPEMRGQEDRIAETLREPDVVILSRRDPSVILYHKFFESTSVSSKYLMVAVKILHEDAFVITAFFTNQIKKGEQLWP